MTKNVIVEEEFPVTVRRRFTITIPRNIRELLQNRGIVVNIGDTIHLAFVKKEANSDDNIFQDEI